MFYYHVITLTSSLVTLVTSDVTHSTHTFMSLLSRRTVDFPLLTRHKQQWGNFKTPIGTKDTISIESGFKRLENELEGLLS